MIAVVRKFLDSSLRSGSVIRFFCDGNTCCVENKMQSSIAGETEESVKSVTDLNRQFACQTCDSNRGDFQTWLATFLFAVRSSLVTRFSRIWPVRIWSIKTSGLCMVLGLMTACASSQPRNVTDVCDIFDDRRSWYRAAKSAEQRWQIPIAVNMAFIYQESSFRARARPARDRFLWIFPGRRPSSAYGYAQALDSTWRDYEERSGNSNASRSDFADAIDFVAWYNATSNRISGIPTADARHLYYAYHEGNGGYQRGTYRSKEWLLQAADRVQSNATRFEAQLASCRTELDKNWFQRLLS